MLPTGQIQRLQETSWPYITENWKSTLRNSVFTLLFILVPLHLLSATVAERRQTDVQLPGQYCSLDVVKEVPSSRLHIPVLFKTITTRHVSKGQGRKRNTCSGLSHEITLSCSAWEKNFRCTVWEESSCGLGRGNSFCYRGLNSTSQFSSALRNSSCLLGTIICRARHPAQNQLSSQQTLEHAPMHRQETTGLNLQSRLCDSFSLLPASPPHPLLKGKTVPFPSPSPSHPLRKAGPPVHSLLGAVAAVGGVGSGAEVVQQVQSAFCSLDRVELLLHLLPTLLGSLGQEAGAV